MPRQTEALSFAGRLSADLYVSVDTPDADFVVKVVDIHPDGFCHPLATCILRASARQSFVDRQPLKPGEVYRLTIDIGHCAVTILHNHRLCVQIQGSHLPIYDRNTNTGEGPFGAKAMVAVETVYHDHKRPSRVLLPLLPSHR